MPAVTLEMAPLSLEQKKELAARITKDCAEVTHLPPASIYVFIKENPLENVGVGGILLSERSKTK